MNESTHWELRWIVLDVLNEAHLNSAVLADELIAAIEPVIRFDERHRMNQELDDDGSTLWHMEYLTDQITQLVQENGRLKKDLEDQREQIAKAIEKQAMPHCDDYERSCACAGCTAYDEAMDAVRIARHAE